MVKRSDRHNLSKIPGRVSAPSGSASSLPDLQIANLPPERLRSSPDNARTHSKKQLKQIVRSIERFGFVNPVLVSDDCEIIAGHGRVEAAKMLGLKEVPTVRLSNLSPAERRAYMITDNRLAELAGWDRALLASELKGLLELQFDDIELTGFSLGEIDGLLDGAVGRKAEKPGREDELPANSLQGPAVCKSGDLWLLGSHRLLCGDARGLTSYQFLLEGEQADLVLTDPLVDVASEANNSGRNPVDDENIATASGELSEAQSIAFLMAVLQHAKEHAKDGAVLFVFMDWQQLYPAMRLARDTDREIMTTMRGKRYTTSIEGTLTGLGGNLVIIDDPLKQDDAHSEAVRRRTIEWYRSTLLSRPDDKQVARILLVMQRVHQDDLAGYLEEQGGFEILNLPAIATQTRTYELGAGRSYVRQQGELLHPSHEPESVLRELKREMGPIAFSAQYQQSPIPPGGTIIKRKWFTSYDYVPTHAPGDHIIMSWDIALSEEEKGDYFACVVLLRRKEVFFVLEVIRGRLRFDDLRRKILEVKRRYVAATLLIEDSPISKGLIQSLEESSINVTKYAPETDKRARLIAQSDLFAGGSVRLPKRAPWLEAFTAELLAFPGRHDDQVDALNPGTGLGSVNVESEGEIRPQGGHMNEPPGFPPNAGHPKGQPLRPNRPRPRLRIPKDDPKPGESRTADAPCFPPCFFSVIRSCQKSSNTESPKGRLFFGFPDQDELDSSIGE